MDNAYISNNVYSLLYLNNVWLCDEIIYISTCSMKNNVCSILCLNNVFYISFVHVNIHYFIYFFVLPTIFSQAFMLNGY